MHSLPELKRLNAVAADEKLHPLVAASIRSIEEQRPLSAVQRAEFQREVSYHNARGAELRDVIRHRGY